MTLLQIPVDEALLARAGLEPGRESETMRTLAAVKLFELRRITLGQAAQLSGMSLWEFHDILRSWGVSWSNLTPEQLADDLRNA
jgi:predicted HTH domain antitoxin